MDSAKKIFSNFIFNLKFFYRNFIFNFKNQKKESPKNFFRNLLKFLFSSRFIFSHYFMLFLIFILSLTSVYLFFSRFRTVEAYDAWYNENWLKRQKVVVTYTNTGTITDYIAQASLPTQTLISSGLMKSDCTDIRVIDSSFNSLSYWVDPQGCNKSITKVFFKVPFLYGTDGSNLGVNIFYLYYGNSIAPISTVAQTSLFTATVPNLKANYSFDKFTNNILPDNSDLGNDAKFILSPSTDPSSNTLYANSSFPEGYNNSSFFFNGQSVYVSTPIRMIDLTKAYTLISFIKPEGTRANGYTPKQYGGGLGKVFNFENIFKTGTLCNAAEYQEGDGASACVSDGLLYTPDATTQKKTGTYSYFYDYYTSNLTRPSRSVTLNGTTQYLYQNNPVNFLPWTLYYQEFSQFMNIKPEGAVGDRRTILTWGNTAPGVYSYALDYNICTDGSLRFILDYNNSRNDNATLATPCLNNVSPSSKISSNAGKFAYYANSNTWLNIATAQFDNKRYILVNGQVMASDAASNVNIERENVRLYLGRASNSSKLNFKGEIDEFLGYGNDQDWFRTAFYTNNVFNSTVQQTTSNAIRKSYVIFGNYNNSFFQAGFSNFADGSYNTATAISNFNYNFNTSDANDFYQQYGNSLASKSSYISGTFDLFDGNWYQYYTSFDDARNSITSNYVKGDSTYSYEQGYTNTNPNGNLIIGAYVNTNDDTATYPSEYFFGGIDDVYIYTATLSATQLAFHSRPWNGYGSYGKTVWQSPLPIGSIGKISYSQDYKEESQNVFWYNNDYPFRVQVKVDSFPNLTIPNFVVSFTLNTSTPIAEKKMNSDCSGVLVNDSFYRILPFWVEGCNKTNTKFFVRMNPDESTNTNATYSIKGGKTQLLNIYYGNEKSTVGTYPVNEVFDYVISGLEVAYSFDDDTSTTGFDKSGNGVNITWVSRTNSSAGAFGSSPYFNGSANYGSAALARATIAGWNGISILSWNKNQGNNNTVSRFIYSQLPNVNNGFNYGQEYVAPYYHHSVGMYATNSILKGTLGEWPDVNNFYHSAYVWNFGSGNSMKLYFGGALSNTLNNGTLYQSFPNTQNVFTVGSLNKVSNYWSGAIDEIRIFNRELSSTEIKYYTFNTTIGSSSLDTTNNTCNILNNFCMRSYVTPSFPDNDLLAKYNSNITYSTSPEQNIESPYIYFKFNEGKSIYIGDSSNRIGTSYLGRIRTSNLQTGNEPSWIPESKCIEGDCLYFDGLNDFVDVATIPGSNADSYINFNSNYSYSFWIKPLSNPNSQQTIISFGQPTNAQEGYVLYYDSSMKLYTFGSGPTGTYTNSTSGTLPINRWSHITFSYDSSSMTNKFYINGVLDSQSTNPSACTSNACTGISMNQIHLGGNASGSSNISDFMRGYLDEFKIYKMRVSDDFILSEYRKGLNTLKYNLSVDPDTVSNFNLVAYYPFDEVDRNVGFDYSDVKAEAKYMYSANVNTTGIFNNAFQVLIQDIGKLFEISDSGFINLTSQATYSIWVDPAANSSGYILYKAGTGGFNISYNSTTQKYSANICGVSLTTNNNFSSTVWDQVVLTSNSKKAKLYVNSVLEDEEYCFNNYVGSSSNTNKIYIGGSVASDLDVLIGSYDEFRIYDNYLTNQQVKLLYDYKPTYATYGGNVTAFYKLDASDGTTTAVDASGNSNTLTMFASATNQNSWNTFGKIGNSYDFTTNASTTKNLFSATTSTMTTGLTQPYSMMGWIAFSEPFYGNYTMAQPPLIMMIGAAGGANQAISLNIQTNLTRVLDLRMFSNNADADRIFFSSPYLYLTIGAKNPIWYHVAGTWDGYLRKLYVNGELVNVDTGTSTTFSIGASGIVLGGGHGSYTNNQFQFNGMLDEAKIYNYARTKEQINMDMRNMSTSPALNSTFYSNIRSNQKQTILTTVSDSSIYPVVDINFDGYFTSNTIFQNGTPVQLEDITFNSVPINVQNYQLLFSLPFTTYNSARFSHPDCANLIITDEKGRKLQYWGEPNSCKNGIGNIVVKIPYTVNPQRIMVTLDPYTTPSGYFRNYSSQVGDVFDFSIPNLVAALNFEETSGNVSADLSGNGNNVQWASRTNSSTGAFGRAPFFDGTNHFGSMPFFTTAIRSTWSGFSFFGWIWANSSKTMNVIDFPRPNSSNYFSYGRFWESAISTNYQSVRAFSTTSYNFNNNNGSEYIFRGFTARFTDTATNWLGIYDDGARSYNASIGRVGNSFPNSFNLACLGRTGTTTGLCTTNTEGWVGSFDEVRMFSRELSTPEYQAYMQNSTNSYIPLGNSGVIGSGVANSTNVCNIQDSWCTKSFVTPSYPGVDILGKYNSRVFPSYSTKNYSVFSVANSNASYAKNGGVRGDGAFLSAVNSQIYLNATHLNFLSGSDAAVSFYIKPTNTTVGTLATSNGLQIKKITDNQINFSGAGFNLTSNRTLPSNSWTHVFFQKNGQTGVYELFLDNVLQASSYVATNNLDLSNFKFIMDGTHTFYLDEFKIYDTVLTQNAISNLQNGGFGINFGSQDSSSCVNGSSSACSAPEDEFLFDESSGTTLYNSANIGSDLSLGSNSRDLGYTGRSLKFNGSTSLATNLMKTNTQASFSFWFKEGGNGNLISADGLDILTYSDQYEISINKLKTIWTGSSWDYFHNNGYTAPWHHLTVNYNTSVTPATYSFYLDGVFLNSGTFTKTVGNEVWMSGVTGYLDNLKFFNYQRDASQIAQEYARGLPYAYFKFEECNGNKIFNSNSQLYRPLQFRENGTRTDAAAFLNTGLNLTKASGDINLVGCNPGKFNSSFYFDGNWYMEGNDYHSRTFNSEGNATITFWINLKNNITQNVTLLGSADGTNSHLIKLENKDIKIYTNTLSTTTLKLSENTDLTSDGWNHVALVFENGSDYKIYINGALDATTPGTFTSILNTCTGGRPVSCTNRPFVLGKSFIGNLDELKIYNYPLTQKQIKIDMNQGAGVRVE